METGVRPLSRRTGRSRSHRPPVSLHREMFAVILGLVFVGLAMVWPRPTAEPVRGELVVIPERTSGPVASMNVAEDWTRTMLRDGAR